MTAATGRTTLRVRPGNPLSGTAQVPPDCEVAQRALLLAALAEGESSLAWPSAPNGSNLAVLAYALRALGVPIQLAADAVHVRGVGLDGLRMPNGVLDAGRSVSNLALIAGLLSGQRFGTRIITHAALTTRSVEHLVGPLRARGAHIAGRSAGPDAPVTPPLSVAPLVAGERLAALDCELPAPDAYAKAAVLINALFASGSTTLSEPAVSADHLERLMVLLDLPLRRIGSVVCFEPQGWNRRISAQTLPLPGCTTCAAYLSAAALLSPGSRIALRGAGINPTRTGFFDVLRLWGAEVEVLPRGEAGREPIADLLVRPRPLRGGVLGGELLLRAGTEVPALALLGGRSARGVQLYDLQELVFSHELDLASLPGVLHALGYDAQLRDGALQVSRTPGEQEPAAQPAHDDPQLAMAAVIAGLHAEAETRVEHGVDALLQAHPGFIEALQSLGADIVVQGSDQ